MDISKLLSSCMAQILDRDILQLAGHSPKSCEHPLSSTNRSARTLSSSSSPWRTRVAERARQVQIWFQRGSDSFPRPETPVLCRIDKCQSIRNGFALTPSIIESSGIEKRFELEKEQQKRFQ